MAKAKAEALELIKRLPDDVTTGAIMEELFFKQQVEKGLQDVAEGRVLTHEELKERIARWRKSLVTDCRERSSGDRRLYRPRLLPPCHHVR